MARRALPVVRVAQVLDVVLGAVGHRYGPVPDRCGVGERVELGLVLRRPEVLGDDRHLVGDVVEVRLGRPGEREDDLVGALHGHVRQRAAVRLPQGVHVERRVSLEGVERVEDVGRAERLAVAPLDAAADGEGQGRVVGVPGGCPREPRGHDVRAVGVRLERVDELERLVDEADRRAADGRVERVELAGPGLPLSLSMTSLPPINPVLTGVGGGGIAAVASPGWAVAVGPVGRWRSGALVRAGRARRRGTAAAGYGYHAGGDQQSE